MPEDIAWLGLITILPLPLGPDALAAAALRSALDGLASLMYALRLAASDATPSPRRGCSRICPSLSATRSGLVFCDPSPGSDCPDANSAASNAFAWLEFNPKWLAARCCSSGP